MSKLPPPPPEVPVDTDVSKLAPVFYGHVVGLLTDMQKYGHDPVIFEGFRSDERAAFLYGFGRDYDDGRGIVTKAQDGSKTWHRYGLAVDIVSKSHGWDAPQKFWDNLRDLALANNLTPGGAWKFADKPHVQHHEMPISPTDADWQLVQKEGIEAVWRKYSAEWEQHVA